jgi:septal ring factor EnvC (AmiA/AmiB activator)
VGERSRLAENAPVDVNMPFLLEDEEEMEADEVARLCALLAQERQRCSQLQRDLGASREGNDRLKRRVRNLEDRLEKVSEVLEREVEERQGTALKLEKEVEAHQATKLRLQATKDDLHRLRRSVGNLRLVASSSRVSSERP